MKRVYSRAVQVNAYVYSVNGENQVFGAFKSRLPINNKAIVTKVWGNVSYFSDQTGLYELYNNMSISCDTIPDLLTPLNTSGGSVIDDYDNHKSMLNNVDGTFEINAPSLANNNEVELSFLAVAKNQDADASNENVRVQIYIEVEL